MNHRMRKDLSMPCMLVNLDAVFEVVADEHVRVNSCRYSKRDCLMTPRSLRDVDVVHFVSPSNLRFVTVH